MGGFTTSVAVVSPKEIWTYSRRATNVEILFNKSTSSSEIYRAVQYLNSGDTVIGKISDVPENGVLIVRSVTSPNYGTETILETGFNPANMKDFNDSTYATPVTDLNAGEKRTHVMWDLGSSKTVLIRYKILGADVSAFARILGSNDNSTYTTLVESNNTIKDGVLIATYRYFKLQSENKSTTSLPAAAFLYYTVEIYPLNPLPLNSSVTVPQPLITEVILAKSGSGLASAFLAIVRKYLESLV